MSAESVDYFSGLGGGVAFKGKVKWKWKIVNGKRLRGGLGFYAAV